MGEEARSHEAELKERRGQLQKAEKRVAALVDVLASGERSSALSSAVTPPNFPSARSRSARRPFAIRAALRADERIVGSTPSRVGSRDSNGAVRRGVFTNVTALRDELKRFIAAHNRYSAKPFVWRKWAAAILGSVGVRKHLSKIFEINRSAH